jgi:hypothetical protein
MAQEALAAVLDEGGTPRLVEPIPALSLVALDVLLSARLREWILVDGAAVTMFGHAFTICGWQDSALLMLHEGVAE